MGPIPPARHADVFRGSRPPWRQANPDAVRTAVNHFRLPVSPAHQFVRYDRQWWLPIRGGGRRLLLWRQENNRPRWRVLAKSLKGRIRDLSFDQPVAINPMGQGLRFVFRGEEWDNVWQMAEGFRILYYRQNERLYDGEIKSWMAVARDEEGWKRLLPCGRPVPRRPTRMMLKATGWFQIDSFSCRYRHDSVGTYPRQAHDVVFNGDHHVLFVLPNQEDPKYLHRNQKRRIPTLRKLASLFSLIPLRLLTAAVSRVVIHTRNHRNVMGEYTPGRKQVDLYPSAFRQLRYTVFHEVFGHGFWPEDRSDLESLWVSAMLADGSDFPRSRLSQFEDEDFAISAGMYFSGRRSPRYSHRFALLDRLLTPDGAPITRREVQRGFSLFRVDGDRLVMRGC